jgi:hypothetical protein
MEPHTVSHDPVTCAQEASDVCYMIGVLTDTMVIGYEASTLAKARGIPTALAAVGGSDEPEPVDRRYIGERCAKI